MTVKLNPTFLTRPSTRLLCDSYDAGGLEYDVIEMLAESIKQCPALLKQQITALLLAAPPHALISVGIHRCVTNTNYAKGQGKENSNHTKS